MQLMIHLVLYKTCAAKCFFCQVELFLHVIETEDSGVLVSSPCPITRSSTRPAVGARCYHLSCTWWFYQVILVNLTKMICSDFRRPLDLLLGSVFLSTTCSYPLGGVVIKFSRMVVSVKESVS